MEASNQNIELTPTARSSPFSEGIGPGLFYLLIRSGAWMAERTPEKLAGSVARGLGSISFRMSKRKRAVVTANLKRVVGDGVHLQHVVRSAFISYAEYWLETFRLGRYSKQDLLDMVRPTPGTVEAIDEALAEGKGLLLATGHIGFYDLGVAWVGSMGWPFTTVAEVLKPRALFEWFAGIRAQRGMNVIPASRGPMVRQQLASIMAKNEGVAILADRDLGRRGIWADFFGERTTFPASPTLLVVDGGMPLLVGAIYKAAAGYEVIFERVAYELSGDRDADVGLVSQLIANKLEELVLRAPEQWHIFSTNWPSDEPHLPPRGGSKV